uniref:NADH-cytochrome b5 reductase n=1 Tax=Anthurium amnicola TaxID=1678845 RepID=A0A1D1Y7U9_9ARAE
MALLLRRLARASPVAALGGAFGDRRKCSTGATTGGARRFSLGAAAAVSSGVAFLYAWTSPSMGHLEEQSQETSEKVALNPEKWMEFKLHEVARASHNSMLFRFIFDRDAKLGLDIASCVVTRAPLGLDAEGKTKYVIRPYTPISDLDSKGYFDLLIKVYPEGKMSQYMASLKPGDVLEVKGPIEKFRYSPNMKKQIGMIAGGTGITPMLQVITAILKNPDDNTQVSLLYANVSPDDVMLKGKLDELAASHPNLKIFYTVDRSSKNWRGGSGYISKDMILKGLPGPGEDTMILVCGPPGMMQHISGEKAKDWTQGELSGLLKETGYTEEMVYKF